MFPVQDFSDPRYLKRRREAFAEANRLAAAMGPIPGLGWSRSFSVPENWGLGDVTSQQITSSIGASLAASGAVVMAIPGGQLPGAIIVAVGALTSIIGGLFKPDLTKIEASNIVNQIEAQTLKPMRASWQALSPAEKTPELQAHYLNVFDQAWNGVLRGCSNPALGTAGENCIGDRQQGACHYTVEGQTPGTPPNCGNWFVWYRDPIAHDPDVAANIAAASIATETGGTSPTTTPAGGTQTDGGTGSVTGSSQDYSLLYWGLGLVALAGLIALSGGGD